MATGARQSTGTATVGRTTNEPPPYEALTFPLNTAAQRALAALTETHKLKKLDESLSDARSALSNSAGEINDRLTNKERATKKRKEVGGEDVDDEALERSLEEFRDKVDRMTQRMDENMRKLIDGQHAVQFIKESINSTAETARMNASTQASTQTMRSPRARPRKANADEDEGEGDADYQDFEPTDPAASVGKDPTPIENFRTNLDNAKTRYQSHSLTSRYADNNDYRDFKRVVHDARNPDDEVPLEHHSKWFDEGGAPAPGVTTRAQANAEDDEDDDIAISRTTISTKCPLTLQEFQTPLTSKKCPHSFESEAILSMISTSSQREASGPRGERFVQCPVPGCSQRLTRTDLHTDAVLLRKIKRIQRAKELADEDAEEEGRVQGGTQRAMEIEDGDDAADVDDIVDDHVVPLTQMKKEKLGSARPSPTAGRSQRNVVDLSDEDEAEEENVSEEEEE